MLRLYFILFSVVNITHRQSNAVTWIASYRVIEYWVIDASLRKISRDWYVMRVGGRTLVLPGREGGCAR